MKTIIFLIGVDVLGFPIACIHRKREYYFNNVRTKGTLIPVVDSEIKTLY